MPLPSLADGRRSQPAGVAAAAAATGLACAPRSLAAAVLPLAARPAPNLQRAAVRRGDGTPAAVLEPAGRGVAGA